MSELALSEILSDCGSQDPLDSFGSELRWAHRLSVSKQYPRVLPQLERLRARPAVEPVLLKRWPLFQKWEFSSDGINRMVSDLVGTQMHLRTEPVFSGPNPPVPYVVFPAPVALANWVDSVNVLGKVSKHSPLIFAALVYAHTVLNHPYSNGNGRLARGLVHAVFANRMNYACPFLPIGPALLMDRETAVLETLALSRTGDWDRFTTYFVSRVDFGLGLLKLHQADRRPR